MNKCHIKWSSRKVYKHIFLLDLSYLQCTGATVIKKAVLPGQGSCCTKRASLRVFPTRVGARCQIFVSRANLRTRLWPFKNDRKKHSNNTKEKCKQTKRQMTAYSWYRGKLSCLDSCVPFWACKFWWRFYNWKESNEIATCSSGRLKSQNGVKTHFNIFRQK